MIVRDLIKWLETQDQGATVKVVVVGRGGWAGAYEADTMPFDPELSEYVDMRGNQFAVGKPYENDRTLLLGETT